MSKDVGRVNICLSSSFLSCLVFFVNSIKVSNAWSHLRYFCTWGQFDHSQESCLSLVVWGVQGLITIVIKEKMSLKNKS